MADGVIGVARLVARLLAWRAGAGVGRDEARERRRRAAEGRQANRWRLWWAGRVRSW